MGKTVLVASGKGGTGKTMFAINFGASLSKLGKKTLIIDMDLGLRNLDLYLGVENSIVYDAHDVMTGVCRIKQAILQDKRFDSLYMMSASPSKEDGSLTPLHMKVLCDKLSTQFDYIVIDAPSGIDDGLTIAAAGADMAIIVTNAEYSALRDADALDRQLSVLGINERYVVLNKIIADLINMGYAPSLKDVTELLRPELVGAIQFDENIQISTNLGIPIVLKEDTYIRENFMKITERILEAE